MLASDIDRQARALLQDKSVVHWEAEDMLDWINQFQLDVLAHKPKAFTVNENIHLLPNVSRPTVAAGRTQVVDVLCNMGSDGETPGRAITLTTIERMNAARPSWRSDTDLEIRHWMVDHRDPRSFLVWPTPIRAIEVEALTVVIPDEITTLDDTLTLDDSYATAGVNFALHKAYSQDGIDTLYEQLSASHYLLYANIIGIQVKGQKRASPGANSPSNPAFPAVEKNGAEQP